MVSVQKATAKNFLQFRHFLIKDETVFFERRIIRLLAFSFSHHSQCNFEAARFTVVFPLVLATRVEAAVAYALDGASVKP